VNPTTLKASKINPFVFWSFSFGKAEKDSASEPFSSFHLVFGEQKCTEFYELFSLIFSGGNAAVTDG
jgi:hypothetical protein